MNATETRIEQTGNVAWAVITADGIAVYPGSEDAVNAVLSGTVEPTPEDAAWYAERGPWHPCKELTARVTESARS